MSDLDWKTTIVNQNDSIEEVISVLNNSSQQIALVVDHGRLVGTITDGDIRRAFLKHLSLQAKAIDIMNDSPITSLASSAKESIIKLMEDKAISQIPLVDNTGRLVGLETLHHLLVSKNEITPVFIMAGGFGKRLAPMTDDCPKPMLPVAGIPLLERIVSQLSELGFKELYLSVHYLSEKIINYFDNGHKWGVNIHYVCEDKPLGTAGALSLLPGDVSGDDLIVMNGDVLTSLNVKHLLSYHHDNNALATMAIRKYPYKIPCGVVSVEGDNLIKLVEKPTKYYFISAGIYVLNKTALEYVNKNQYLDMPDLLDLLLQKKQIVKTFPIHEDWLDVGRKSDFNKANTQYKEVMA